MLDKFNRQISYLRISVTDKCNLRCTYCMPEEGVSEKLHEDMLSFEQIVEVVAVGVSLGLSKIRLTGGEPLVRRGIVDLVRMVKNVNGVEQVLMTTNGTKLTEFAPKLANAGLDGVNVSLDTLDPDRFRKITRRGNIAEVLAGIDAAMANNLPVKINMVVSDKTTNEENEAMQDFCRRKHLTLSRIRYFSIEMPKTDNQWFDRPPRCDDCNRLRLLADGTLKPCLHSDCEIKLDLNDIKSSLISAIQSKPARGAACTNRNMIEIGG